MALKLLNRKPDLPKVTAEKKPTKTLVDNRDFSEKLFDIQPHTLLVFGASGINHKLAGTLTKAGWMLEFHKLNRNSLCLKLFNELEKLCWKSAYLPRMEKEYKELLTAFDLICHEIWQKKDGMEIEVMRKTILDRMRAYQMNICNRICLLMI